MLVCICFPFFALHHTALVQPFFFLPVLMLAFTVALLWMFVTYAMWLQVCSGGTGLPMTPCPWWPAHERCDCAAALGLPCCILVTYALLQPSAVLLFLQWAQGCWLVFNLWSLSHFFLLNEWLMVEVSSMQHLRSLQWTAENTCNVCFFPHHPLS